MPQEQRRLQSCAQLVQGEFEDRLKELRTVEGLCFDYVDPNTFNDQLEGYWRWQLSWGGPGDEFRIYVNPDKSVHRIEYWYMDWYDGAKVTLSPEHALRMRGVIWKIWWLHRDRIAPGIISINNNAPSPAGGRAADPSHIFLESLAPFHWLWPPL